MVLELDYDYFFLAFYQHELDIAEVAEKVINLLSLDLVDALNVLHEKDSAAFSLFLLRDLVEG